MNIDKLREADEINGKIEDCKEAISIIQKAKGDITISLVYTGACEPLPLCIDRTLWPDIQFKMLLSLNEAVSTLQKRFDSL